MKNKLKYLVGFSLRKKIKSKWFLVVNIILVMLIIGLTNMDTIVKSFGGDFDKPTSIIIKDETGQIYNSFKLGIKQNQSYLTDTSKIKLSESNETNSKLIKQVKKNDSIAIIIKKDNINTINAEVISNGYIDNTLYQTIVSSLNSTKVAYAMSLSNINQAELNKINTPLSIKRNILDDSKSEKDETMSFIMGIVFPSFILPFYVLIIFLVQMIGGEINEEKTTKSMEIIISNVSPKTHFISKIIASNLFIFIQFLILLSASGIGILIRNLTTKSTFNLGSDFDLSTMWNQIIASGIAGRLIYVIPLTIVLIILSFLAYSLIAGILASMTTSIEDFQQLQTPIILICFLGYYLAMMAPAFEGSIFIRIISYLPFISTLLAPPLLLIGQIGIVDICISILVLLGTIYIMLTYGMKIYKVGILNYSSSKLWRKMFKAVKQ